MKTTSTPAVEWPPGGAAPTRDTASPGRATTDFGALLDQHQARTAIAEGPKRDGEKTSVARRDDRRDDAAPARSERAKLPERLERADRKDAPQGEQQPSASAADGKPAAEQARQPQAGTEQQTAGQQQPQGEQGQPTGPVEVVEVAPVLAILDLVAAPVTTEAAPAVAAAVVTTPEAGVPVAATQSAVATAPVAPVAAAVVPDQVVAAQIAQVDAAAVGAQPLAASTGSGTPIAVDIAAPQAQQQAAQPQAPAGPSAGPQLDATAARAAAQAVPADGQAQQQAGEQQVPQSGLPQQAGDQQPVADTTQQPTAAAAAEAPQANRAQPAAAPAGQSATPVTAPAAPAAPHPVGREPQIRGVRLSQTAEAVENAIRIGSTRGVTHARMSLNPAELGGVEIRLQQTAQGLSASVIASGAEAAQVLQQAGQDLRRQLEAQGIELVRLDISYSGEERHGAHSAQAGQGDGERRSPAGDGSAATDGGELTPTDEISVKSTLELPGGVLVDVLA